MVTGLDRNTISFELLFSIPVKRIRRSFSISPKPGQSDDLLRQPLIKVAQNIGRYIVQGDLGEPRQGRIVLSHIGL